MEKCRLQHLAILFILRVIAHRRCSVERINDIFEVACDLTFVFWCEGRESVSRCFWRGLKKRSILSTNFSIATPKTLDNFSISSWLIEVVYPRSQFDTTCADLLIRMPRSFCVKTLFLSVKFNSFAYVHTCAPPFSKSNYSTDNGMSYKNNEI